MDGQRWRVPCDVQDSEATGVSNPVSRLYPKTTGILKTITPDEKFHRSIGRLLVFRMSISRCMEVFDAIRDGLVEGLFVEANICPGGSDIGGPIMRMGGNRAGGHGNND